MIKDKEIAMVHAANYALDYMDKEYLATPEEIIKKFLRDFNSFDIKKEMKVYSVAAINDIMKLKALNKGKQKKQIIQIFVNNIPEFLARIEEGMED